MMNADHHSLLGVMTDRMDRMAARQWPLLSQTS
jgi:hypothetical protein